MKRSSGPRKTANLSESLHQRLNMYALAASAAGVTALALAQPAEAKIVYTPAHVKLSGRPYPLDLNHDGMIDFFLLHYYPHYYSRTNSLLACHGIATYDFSTFCSSGVRNPKNAIRAVTAMSRSWGAALRPGAKIQRDDKFQDSDRVALGGASAISILTSPNWFGPWLDGGKGVKDRYLGIRFEINGRLHFGWARMTVTTTSNRFTAILTGYAYETIPGKAIIAGQTSGSDDIDNSIEQPNPTALSVPTPDPATLGALAMGAPGLSIWRRKESALKDE
jgi:hypothetical protein